MKTAKSFIGLVAALLPILYIGGLLFWFSRLNNATYGLFDRALSPTMFGLAAIGLVFVLLFALKLWRMSRPPVMPRSGGAGPALEEEKSDFDPDAALARYLARRNAAPVPPGDRPPPGSFGRKGA
jgi:hypothetical protein